MSQVIIITDKQGRRYAYQNYNYWDKQKKAPRTTCWFDRKKYKTLAEKKADGEPVLTRAQLDKMAQGRIYHPFDNSTSMYKWNYTVYPSAEHVKAASAAA